MDWTSSGIAGGGIGGVIFICTFRYNRFVDPTQNILNWFQYYLFSKQFLDTGGPIQDKNSIHYWENLLSVPKSTDCTPHKKAVEHRTPNNCPGKIFFWQSHRHNILFCGINASNFRKSFPSSGWKGGHILYCIWHSYCYIQHRTIRESILHTYHH